MIFHGEEHTFEDLADTVRETVNNIQEQIDKGARFHSIVVRGISGVVVGAPVAIALGVPLVIVRKSDDSTHSRVEIENVRNIGMKCLFLDDFRDSGATEKIVAEQIKGHDAEIVCCYFYETDHWNGGGFQAPIDTRPKLSVSSNRQELGKGETMTRSPERKRTQFLADIIVTAVEGGTGYWAAVSEYNWSDENPAETYAVLHEMDDSENPPANALVKHVMGFKEVYNPIGMRLDVDNVATAIRKIVDAPNGPDPIVCNWLSQEVREASNENDAGNIDATIADVIARVALLGEAVYG